MINENNRPTFPLIFEWAADGWTDGRKDGPTDGRTDRRRTVPNNSRFIFKKHVYRKKLSSSNALLFLGKEIICNLRFEYIAKVS